MRKPTTTTTTTTSYYMSMAGRESTIIVKFVTVSDESWAWGVLVILDGLLRMILQRVRRAGVRPLGIHP